MWKDCRFRFSSVPSFIFWLRAAFRNLWRTCTLAERKSWRAARPNASLPSVGTDASLTAPYRPKLYNPDTLRDPPKTPLSLLFRYLIHTRTLPRFIFLSFFTFDMSVCGQTLQTPSVVGFYFTGFALRKVLANSSLYSFTCRFLWMSGFSVPIRLSGSCFKNPRGWCFQWRFAWFVPGTF